MFQLFYFSNAKSTEVFLCKVGLVGTVVFILHSTFFLLAKMKILGNLWRCRFAFYPADASFVEGKLDPNMKLN
jgi:hypothetical protein